MSKVLVVCPSRDRPERLTALCESVSKTSDAIVVAYIDEDQRDLYKEARCETIVGPRIGPVAAANVIVDGRPGFDAYGMLTDDCVVTTPGWDQWVLERTESSPGRICVASPHHNLGQHVDMPFVSKEWIRAVGYFAYPKAFHFVWPIMIGVLGEMTRIAHATESEFHVEHSYLPCQNWSVEDKDCREFLYFVALRNTDDHLPSVLGRLRKAMSA